MYESELPIRPEINETHLAAAKHWASAGTWWSAAERIAIVEEARKAWDAQPLAPWQPPSSIPGLISDDHILPVAAIDVIWRLTNHVSTLTKTWYESFVPDKLSAQQYVEIVGIVAQSTLTDRFADALDLPRVSLAAPGQGQASQQQPDDAAVSSHWVPTAPIVDGSWNPATPTDVPNVRKALSLVAAERIMQWVLIDAHYVQGGALADDFGAKHWSLERAQIELLGTRTSKVNECFY